MPMTTRKTSQRGGGAAGEGPLRLRIGSLPLDNPLILAPMAGVTDLPFRTICRRMGAALVYTEMISAVGLVYGVRNTLRLLATEPAERPLGVQLFGSDHHVMARAAAICQDRGADVLDINMGCPVPKVVRKGAGAALMKDPQTALRIICAVRRVLQIPLTVKMRIGWSTTTITAPELAYRAQEAGVDAVIIHARTRSQDYGTKADWPLIGHIQRKLSIPVIGNGDIFRPQDAVAMQQSTGCRGLLIARGARGNPWIFPRTLGLLQGKPAPGPSIQELERVITQHLELIAEHYPPPKALYVAKTHVLSYVKGLHNSAGLRGRITRKRDLAGLRAALTDYLHGLQHRNDCDCNQRDSHQIGPSCTNFA
jgi:tRNA-dihydrouridine synthase B